MVQLRATRAFSSSVSELGKETPKSPGGSRGPSKELGLFAVAGGVVLGIAAWNWRFLTINDGESEAGGSHLINWSGTHEVIRIHCFEKNRCTIIVHCIGARL